MNTQPEQSPSEIQLKLNLQNIVSYYHICRPEEREKLNDLLVDNMIRYRHLKKEEYRF